MQESSSTKSVLVDSPKGIVAEPYQWLEGEDDGRDGATRDFYNVAASLTWKNKLGDWCDAKGVPQGDSPCASTKVIDDNQARFIEWDVSALVSEWVVGKSVNKGFFLRSRDRCKIDFYSRESENRDKTPQLVLHTDDGPVVLTAEADTELSSSTAFSLGKKEKLRVTDNGSVLVRFKMPSGVSLKSAKLRLFTFAQYGSGNVEVYRCSQGDDLPEQPAQMGIAERHANDVGIAKDQDVIFATGFETWNWKDEWTRHSAEVNFSKPVVEDVKHKFVMLDSKALRVEIRQGKLLALNKRYYFSKEGVEEPSEIFFRYYLRLGDDWNQTLQSGKLPGIGGTYGKGGWGGRKSDGRNGWSARGLFKKTIPDGNPLAGRTPIGTYCYHADMDLTYGDSWVWSRNYLGYLERNQWYCIEHHLRLNSPGKNDGLLEGWVDGHLAFQKSDIRFRDRDSLKIENVWMNVYHGGTKPSPRDQHLFIDNVVVARKYIGPTKRSHSTGEIKK